MERNPLVLVVDDDASLRFVASKQLTVVGLDFHTASHGAEAVEKLENDYDLIFMDLAMPVLDGIEATEKIRKIERDKKRSRTKIIGLTAFNERERCLEAGMDDFMMKPLLLEDLRKIAHELKTAATATKFLKETH